MPDVPSTPQNAKFPVSEREATPPPAVPDASAPGSTNPKVSVVVPVFNTEAYLDECLGSLVSQTLRDIEIVCVDDGSTDGSAAKLAEWAEKDSRIRVLRQENRGGGAARNAGMDAVTGEWLFFCDSDDVCEPEMLEDLFSRGEASGADLSVAQRAIWNKDLTSVVSRMRFPQSAWRKEQPFPGRSAGVDAFVLFGNPAWNKLFRRRFVLEKGIRFQEIPISDDLLFVDLAIAESSAICLSERSLYRYRSGRPGSAVSTFDREPLCLVRSYSVLRDALSERGLLGAFLPALSKALFASGGYQFQRMSSTTALRTAYTAWRELLLSLDAHFPLLDSGALNERQRECYRAFLDSEDPVPFLVSCWRGAAQRGNALNVKVVELKEKLQSESLKRKKADAKAKVEMERVRAAGKAAVKRERSRFEKSLSWRLTAPLRKISVLLSGS